MPELRETLERELPSVPSDPSAALAHVRTRAAGRRSRQRVAVIVALPLVALILALGVTQTLGGTGQSVAAEIDTQLGGTPIGATTGFGSIWVLTCTQGCEGPQNSGQLVRLDARSGAILERIAVSSPSAVAIAAQSVWVADFWTGRVNRIDPRTGRVTGTVSLSLPAPVAPGDRRFLPSTLAAVGGSLWVGTARGRLAQIDAGSGRVVATVAAPADSTGPLALGPHGVWVAASVLGVGHVPTRGDRLALQPIRVGGSDRLSIDAIATGGGLVWAQGAITAPAGGNGAADRSPDGGLTVTDNAAVVILDERTGEQLRLVRLPGPPDQVALGTRGLLVANLRLGRLLQVDARGVLHSLTRVRPGPGRLVAVTRGAIWVTTATGTVRRVTIAEV